MQCFRWARRWKKSSCPIPSCKTSAACRSRTPHTRVGCPTDCPSGALTSSYWPIATATGKSAVVYCASPDKLFKSLGFRCFIQPVHLPERPRHSVRGTRRATTVSGWLQPTGLGTADQRKDTIRIYLYFIYILTFHPRALTISKSFENASIDWCELDGYVNIRSSAIKYFLSLWYHSIIYDLGICYHNSRKF